MPDREASVLASGRWLDSRPTKPRVRSSFLVERPLSNSSPPFPLTTRRLSQPLRKNASDLDLRVARVGEVGRSAACLEIGWTTVAGQLVLASHP